MDSEGVLEHVGASPTLPAGHAEGQPHAVHAALDAAPEAALYVPAPHCVGVAELTGQ